MNENILKRLDDIVFHDVPVEKISFKTEHLSDFSIYFSLYDESKKSFENWIIKFIDITELTSDKLIFNSESYLEIFSFDYKFDELFECKIHFLLGFGQPSFEIKLKCEKIELNKLRPTMGMQHA